MSESTIGARGTSDEEKERRVQRRFDRIKNLTDEDVAERHHLERGCVQVYTGKGKGKTTAALGLALRAKGYGLDVRIIQFGKDKRCSEHVELERMGIPCHLCEGGRAGNAAREQYELACQIVDEGEADVLILDEAMHAMKHNWVTEDEMLGLIARRPARMELVLTGRDVPQRIFEAADLVTEMRPLKHYIDAGVEARRGIEY